MSEERFVALETKVSHQEFLIEKLNIVLTEQQGIIDDLQVKLSVLVNRMKEIGPPEGDVRPHAEKPPHY